MNRYTALLSMAGHFFWTERKLNKKPNLSWRTRSTMINRVRKACNKRRIRESVLRRVRFAHMGYIQPPDREESSDNENLQKWKRLALDRTPYFVIPTFKISRVKKKNRFRNYCWITEVAVINGIRRRRRLVMRATRKQLVTRNKGWEIQRSNSSLLSFSSWARRKNRNWNGYRRRRNIIKSLWINMKSLGDIMNHWKRFDSYKW